MNMKVNNILPSFNTESKSQNNKSYIDFGKIFKESIDRVNSLDAYSQKLDTQLASGEIENIHDVMIAAQKADIALQFTVEVKNKILEAYKEIMRLQL